ncbi:hypothetical protein MMC14_004983 [Varicellaria rhodocarpa]|nr:hypothetical protein [Varicellaria rhodocarpa]
MATSTILPVRTAPYNPNLYNTGLNTTIPDNGCVLASWELAIDLFKSKLTQDEKKRIDLNNCQSASFEELLKAAADAKSHAELKRFRWTPTIRKIFQQINRYAVAGDVIAQYNTEYTSIAWGAFRFLLLFVVEEGTMAEKLSEALDSSIPIVLRAQEYAVLFSSHSGSSTAGVFSTLQENLTHLYAEVLNFLIRATIFFNKRTIRRYISAGFSPFDTQFKAILDRIGKLESSVGKDVALLNSEAEYRRQEYEDGIWLKPADFSTNKDDLLQRHLPGTCGWFIHSDTYRTWRESSKNSSSTPNLLWVQGKPGSGKSILAAQIISDPKSPTDDVICYVFCKYGEENKSDIKDILRNVIYQILCANSRSKSLFNQMVRNARLGARTPYAQNVAQLWSLLQQMLRKETSVCCVIDGLDECSNTIEDQVSFINELSAIFHTAKATTRLAVISRLDRSEIGNPSLWTIIQIHSSDVQEDIVKFVSTKLEESIVLRRHREKDRLQKRLVESSDGMILWADLMIKELEAGHWNVDRVFIHPPKGLGAVYAVIFRRLSTSATVIDVQYILQLLLVAARPLHLHELAMGLALLKGLRNHEDYSLQGDPGREGIDIIRKSTPLLNIMPDETVQLAHSSLKEFLLETEEGNRDVMDFASEKFRFKISDLHFTMASCLITYLSFECFKDQAREKDPQAILFNGNSLLKYSTLYLLTHFIQSPPSTILAGKLTSFFQSRLGWQWLQRLEIVYRLSFGHLQLMQSHLKSWSILPGVDEKYRNVLGGFLLVLAQRRYDDSKTLPTGHEERLTAMSSLAISYRQHGMYNRAERLEVQVMETSSRVLGEEHPSTLSSMANLAATLSNQGRWTEAEKLEVQVMETRKRVLGEKHPSTLSSMANLASTYRNQGRWTEAEKLEVQVMETSSRVLGEEHPFTLSSMANLASIYRNQGRWTKAEKLDIQVMETRKRVLGEKHPSTLSSMANLASTYRNQGRWTEAEKLDIQVMETSSRVLGEKHPSTLSSMANLASTYRNQGRWTEAEKLEVQVMETRKRVLGEEHPDTLSSMNNLAHTYKLIDRHDEAIELMSIVVDLRTKKIGANHPHTLSAVDYLSAWSHT